MIGRFEFGDEALDYVRSCLASGKTLSAHLLQLPLDTGRVWAYLPENVAPEAARSFRMGGVIPIDQDAEVEIFSDGKLAATLIPVRTHPLGVRTEQVLLQFISSYLSESGERYVVFEHALAHPTDPFIQTGTSKFFSYGPEVYHFLSSQDVNLAQIHDTVRSASSYLFIASLTSLPVKQDIQPRQEVSLDTLKTLSNNTVHIIVGAYDGEGELIWSKRAE